jgi:serine/threonine protein kinase
MKCPVCAAPISGSARECSVCGASTDSSQMPTAIRDVNPVISSNILDSGRFTAGTVLAERYRITGRLGKGGMGEVYRAEDLKLGHPVALKFLPEALTTDGAALARFHREVRTARHVSHPNVCRVFDIVEADGLHFIAMEYVDGEDLASLLRRIGRLPVEKALELSRQICAGLAAAHDNDVLHRDLKPANIMIDGRGKARITDFGLAGLSSEFHSTELYAGTPAYMAPEQIAGKEVTVRSDIYSLGMVLYELFTGKRAYEASTLNELIKLKEQTTPTNPSAHVKELDAAVERIIMRCLEKDPVKRPATALQVAAALPGGDPLAAALAAGETPSPEMVAAAPTEGSLQPRTAFALLISTIFLFFLCVFVGHPYMLHSMIPLSKSPEVLKERAKEILIKLGYSSYPHSADWLSVDYDFFIYARNKKVADWKRLSKGHPPVIRYWVRQSALPLIPKQNIRVQSVDPIRETPGSVLLMVDTQGRLVMLMWSPRQIDLPTGESKKMEWSTLFEEAGLNPTRFKHVESNWTPLVPSDEKLVLRGFFDEWPEIPIEIRAAAYRGKAVFFQIYGPWMKEVWGPPLFLGSVIATVALFTVLFGVLAFSSYFAFRNLRAGKGDGKGAFRLVLFMFFSRMLYWFFQTSHTDLTNEMDLLLRGLQSALFWSCLLGILYLALEPIMRRRRPEWIISWSRLLGGNFRDPLVGRDILIGACLGALMSLIVLVATPLPGWFGRLPNTPVVPVMGYTIRDLLPGILNQISGNLVQGFLWSFVVLFCMVLLRSRLAGSIAGVVALGMMGVVSVLDFDPICWPFGFLFGATVAYAIIRYGILAVISSLVFFHMTIFFPLTTNLSAWYAQNFVADLLLLGAVAIYAFRISTAGKPLLQKGLLDE